MPNGGLRSKATAGKLKAEGVKSSVCDLMLPVARAPFHGLFVEMKKLGEYARPSQQEYQRKLIAQGYAAVTCQGHEAAAPLILRYLEHAWNDWKESRDALEELTAGIAGVFTYPP